MSQYFAKDYSGELFELFGSAHLVALGMGAMLFIAHKPETASLMDILPAWPVYILWLEGIAIRLSLLLYLPFAIRDLRHA